MVWRKTKGDKMNDVIFHVGAILNSISHTKDRGMRLGFITNELTGDEKYLVINQMQKYGWLLFSPNQIQAKDIPKDQIEDKNKTPSKRLRNSLYVLWKQLNSNEDFEIFYVKSMEKFIDMVKAKLD
jgi:hypothetical protein